MENNQPLADILRPNKLADYVGQEHILGPGKILEQMLKHQSLSSLIFWGPPGVGKTTLAQIIANNIQAKFIASSAVLIGVADIKKLRNNFDE